MNWVGFEPTTSAMASCKETYKPESIFLLEVHASAQLPCFNETIKEAEKRKKEVEETMIRRIRFERKTSEQVGALV
jgi:hypothetical protein